MSKRSFLKTSALIAAQAALSLNLGGPAMAQDRPLKVGVIGGTHEEIMEEVQKVAARNGLKIEMVIFSDFVQPNAALAAGDLDVNSYQHLPYLEQQVRDRGYKLVPIARTIVAPISVYSKKIRSLEELKPGARVGIPNDPTNGGRVLLMLEEKGLIKINPKAGLRATPLDVTENPKKLRFIELDAAQLARSLDDLDASAINSTYAMSAGLRPSRDSIALESPNGPYANLMAVREEDKDKPWVSALIKAYHSPEIREFIEKKYDGAVIPAF